MVQLVIEIMLLDYAQYEILQFLDDDILITEYF